MIRRARREQDKAIRRHPTVRDQTVRGVSAGAACGHRTRLSKAGKRKKLWKAKYPTSDVLVKELYKKSLGREPLPKELAAAQKIIGKSPTHEGIQDLVWAMALHPEFQLIY